MSDLNVAPVRAWLASPLESEVAAAIERLRRAEDVRRIAVMPDVHLAKDVCIGTVMATRELLYPGAVGGDIGCGMLAVPFDSDASILDDARRAAQILKAMHTNVPAMRRHRSRLLPLPEKLRQTPLGHGSLEAIKRDDAALQLGTLGGGNHFVEMQADEDGRLWLMIRSGSRAIGQAIRGYYVSLGRKTGGLVALDANTDAGRSYVADVEWARQYAEENRRAMAGQVARFMRELFHVRAVDGETIACDHNHVVRECHDGETLWVHRKGAMPADAGLAGVIPGSMGTLSYHVEGRGNAEAMRSSAHGAGRSMSRDAARRQFSARDLCRQMRGVWFDPRGVEQLRDESPRAYKDVRAVMRAQSELVRITRVLRPRLTYKGT